MYYWNKRAENSRKLPMGLQYSLKIPHPDACLSRPLNKNVYWFSDTCNERHTKLKYINELKLTNIQDYQMPEARDLGQEQIYGKVNMLCDISIILPYL